MFKIIDKFGIGIILILFIVVCASGVFYNYGLPSTVGDESTIMSATLKMISDLSFRPNYPTNYYFPLTTYLYLPFLVLVLVVLRIFVFDSFMAMKIFGIMDFAKLLPAARFISVLLGAASIYIVYKITDKLFNNKWIALLAAYFLATSLMFVQISHFARAWVPQIFVVLAAFYFIIYFYQKNTLTIKDYIVAALLIGASFGTHLVGVLVYLPFLVVYYLRNKGKKLKGIILNKRFWLTNILIILFILLIYWLNLYGFSNYFGWASKTVASLEGQDIVGTAGVGADLWQGISYYFEILIEYEPVLLLIFMLGAWPLYKKKKEIFFILFSFVIGYYILIGPIIGSTYAETRYISPLIPFMAIIAAYGMAWFYSSTLINRRVRLALIVILLVATLYLPIKWSWLITRPSTRLMALEWINNNIENDKSIINMDRFLPINENKETISDIAENSKYFYTKKRRYLVSVSENELPQPNYYVLNLSYYKNSIPDEINDRNYDYAVLAWWNEADYEKYIDIARASGLGLDLSNLAIRFPEGAPDNSDRMDIANNMRQPFYYLSRMKTTGPVIDIYKLD